MAQDAIISEDDCGTDAGINVQAVVDAGQIIVSLAQRILGRTAAEDIKDPASKKVMVKSGALLEEKEVEAIEKAQIQEVRIRSVLTCETTNGVQVLRPGSGPRHARQHGRGRWRHRRAVDR